VAPPLRRRRRSLALTLIELSGTPSNRR
jgi:hypothetical protein